MLWRAGHDPEWKCCEKEGDSLSQQCRTSPIHSNISGGSLKYLAETDTESPPLDDVVHITSVVCY